MQRSTIALLAALAAGTACADGDNSAAVPGAPPGTIRFSESKDFPFLPNNEPVRFTVEGSGPRFDSVTVHLTLRRRTGDLLYEHAWSTREYFECEDSSCSADTVDAARGRRQALERMGRVLRDAAFSAPSETFLLRRDTTYVWAKQEGLAEQLWKSDHGLKGADTVPGRDAWLREPGHSLLVARAESLRKELDAQTYFSYETGLHYCVLAGSARLNRVFEVFCGP